MKTMLRLMQKKNSGIQRELLPLFEGIIQKYEELDNNSLGNECDAEFYKAMDEHLTKEQRFRLYEQNGGCMGTGQDERRKAFALEHADKPLAERFEIYKSAYGSNAVLNGDGTITLAFACTHGYYKQAREGKILTPPPVF
jgi:hypothetical protein